MKNNPLKIMLVEDHPIVREGIKKVIELENDMTVCDEADNASDAIRKINSSKPDIIIVDISLKGGTNGIELIKSIKDRYPSIFTIVLSLFEESVYAERAIRAGAMGYIMKKEASAKVIDAIRTVIGGELALSGSISKNIVQRLVHGSSSESENSIDDLTNREFEIFQFVGNGLSTREIAEKLNLSIHTIESHKKNIMKKFNLKNSTKLIKHAVQWVITHN